MRLDRFHIQGFRSLADVQDIPLRSPTILTGHNDGGKTATLAALGFLLGAQVPTIEDHTFQCESAAVRPTDEAERKNAAGERARRAPQVIVTGEFRLSKTEQEELGLPAAISLRRRTSDNDSPVYEILRRAPADETLRGIEEMKLADLKALAACRGVSADGPATKLESWRKPLMALASSDEQVDDWTRASRAIIDCLPVFLVFSSTDVPDPESQIRTVLQASYERMLDDPQLVQPVRELEDQITVKLQAEAQQLCAHIQQRVPELTSVSAIPSLSFRHGLTTVRLRAFRGGEDVGLRQAGAGRQRRISLAVWEWVSPHLGKRGEEQRDVVIAYDEPDTHLDYARQRDLVDLIHAQCQNPLVRMILATHSLNLIDRVDIADVVQLRLDDKGRTLAERLVDDTHAGVDRYMTDLSTALGLRTSVLLHERCFLAVEGPTEQLTFPILFRLVMNKPLQSAGIALISCNGNDGALKVTQFLIEHKRTVVFILDKDSATKKMFSRDRLRLHGITERQVHYVGAPNELEELYSDDQWASTANALWPRKDGRSWSSQDIASARDCGKFSDKLKSLIWQDGEQAPSSKQEMNMGLVLRLRSSDEVPKQLRTEFEAVASLARGDLAI